MEAPAWIRKLFFPDVPTEFSTGPLMSALRQFHKIESILCRTLLAMNWSFIEDVADVKEEESESAPLLYSSTRLP